ncbi:uncharacterized protein B0T15DRAFT_322161 [Chaetomium strumarium]|uniref:Uncharacterized protein n=1 Tax=Chaetomium strumarium TaxID=1170767 RepID=A0AAJ0GKR2_9PEZI|nr:hypothetical protein B0T15DRAFT_322161 [Chaetomium strumarium]
MDVVETKMPEQVFTSFSPLANAISLLDGGKFVVWCSGPSLSQRRKRAFLYCVVVVARACSKAPPPPERERQPGRRVIKILQLPHLLLIKLTGARGGLPFESRAKSREPVLQLEHPARANKTRDKGIARGANGELSLGSRRPGIYVRFAKRNSRSGLAPEGVRSLSYCALDVGSLAHWRSPRSQPRLLYKTRSSRFLFWVSVCVS